MSDLPVKGDRIELLAMPHDPDPIPTGSTGTVLGVTDLSCIGDNGSIQIQMDWDPEVGRSLNLCCPPDRYRIIERVMD